MKTLVESLFDKDLVKRKVSYENLLEVVNWEWATHNDMNIGESSFSTTFDNETVTDVYNSPKWKKFTSDIGDKYIKQFDTNNGYFRYGSLYTLPYFTSIIMSCSSMKEIERKLNEFIEEVKNKKRSKTSGYIKSIFIVPLEGVGDMKGLPRLITLRLNMEHVNKAAVLYLILDKKD